MAEAAADESLRARLFSVQGQQFLLPAFARFETLDTRPSITIVLRDSGFEQRCPLTPYVTPAPAAPRLEPEQRQELPQLAEPDAGPHVEVVQAVQQPNGELVATAPEEAAADKAETPSETVAVDEDHPTQKLAQDAALPAAESVVEPSAARDTAGGPVSGISDRTQQQMFALDTIPDSLPEPSSPPSADKEKENATPPAANGDDDKAGAAQSEETAHKKGGRAGKQRARAGAKSAPPSKKMRQLSPVVGSLSPARGAQQFTWKQLELIETFALGKPIARWGGTMTAISDTQALLYGGADESGPLADAWILDVEEGKWVALSPSERPKSWHSADYLVTERGRYVFVFGGEGTFEEEPSEAAMASQDEEEKESQVLTETWMLDLADQPDDYMWIEVPVEGEQGRARLPDRSGHSSTLLPDGRILIFGGQDSQGNFHNDFFLLDARRLKWFALSKGTVRGAPPKPRAYHTATLVGNRIIVLGGNSQRYWSLKEVYSLTVDNFHWKEHTSQVEGEAPSPRGGHSACAMPDGRHLLVFGGGNIEINHYLATVALLDTQTWRWTSINVQGAIRPSGRSGHSMAVLQPPGKPPMMLLHGGRTWQDQLVDDAWLLQLPSV